MTSWASHHSARIALQVSPLIYCPSVTQFLHLQSRDDAPGRLCQTLLDLLVEKTTLAQGGHRSLAT